MPHNFGKYKGRKIVVNLTGLQTFGFNKLYRCKSCHNLQTMLSMCVVCCTKEDYKDNTLIEINRIDPILAEIAEEVPSGIPST